MSCTALVRSLPESKRWGDVPAAEFETGNLTIAVMQSDAFGLEFRANNHPIELRVDDFEAARALGLAGHAEHTRALGR
jgi:hypothetical protein